VSPLTAPFVSVNAALFEFTNCRACSRYQIDSITAVGRLALTARAFLTEESWFTLSLLLGKFKTSM